MSLLATTESNGVATITLDDPEVRNRISLPMVDEMVAALDRYAADESVSAIVVTGAAPAFCAGADLGDLSNADEQSLRAIYEAFLVVARSPLVTIAAVNGAAVGAGVNLALACDVRLVGSSGRFDTRFLQIGLHSGGGHSWMLQRVAGPQTAAATLLCGDVVAGDEAVRVGLAYRCVADDELLAEAQRLGERAAGAPRELLVQMKRTLADIDTAGNHDEAMQRELEPQLWSTRQPWFAERIAALQQRISKR